VEYLSTLTLQEPDPVLLSDTINIMEEISEEFADELLRLVKCTALTFSDDNSNRLGIF
jgi:hypothetical protein